MSSPFRAWFTNLGKTKPASGNCLAPLILKGLII